MTAITMIISRLYMQLAGRAMPRMGKMQLIAHFESDFFINSRVSWFQIGDSGVRARGSSGASGRSSGWRRCGEMSSTTLKLPGGGHMEEATSSAKLITGTTF